MPVSIPLQPTGPLRIRPTGGSAKQYVDYLRTVDFNLDTVFSTPAGTQLAIDTSHTLTPAIVQYTIDECGLSFGDEQQPPPTTK